MGASVLESEIPVFLQTFWTCQTTQQVILFVGQLYYKYNIPNLNLTCVQIDEL